MKTLIVGVGGAGTNLIKAMQDKPDRAFLAVNTDADALRQSGCTNTLLIGKEVCGGVTTGGLAKLGRVAADASRNELQHTMEGYQQLAVIAGFGGGTGTGAAPVIAELGHQLGLRVILVVVLPFAFETSRLNQAKHALKPLENVPFKLLTFANSDSLKGDSALSLDESFALMETQVADALDAALQQPAEVSAGMAGKGFDPDFEPRRLAYLAHTFLKNSRIYGSVILRSDDAVNDAFVTRWFLSKKSLESFQKSGFKQKLNEQLCLFKDRREQANHLLSCNAEVQIQGERLAIRWLPADMADRLEEKAIQEQHRQIVLDTETTGLSPSDDRIIEIGCVELINNKPTGIKRHWYLNPEQAISKAAFSVHGISNDFLADQPTFAEIVDDLLGLIREADLIIHHAPFDLGFLNAELARNGYDNRIETQCNIIDTLPIARRLHPDQKNNLDALCQRYKIDNSQRDLHGALLDAELLAEVYQAMFN